MNERIARLAAYAQGHEIYPEIVKVDYDRCDLFLTELKRDTKRLCEYMLAQPVSLLPDMRLTGFFHFDGSVPSDLFHRTGHRHFNEICSQFYNKPLENLATFEWQHSTGDFRYAIEHGMEGYLERIAASKRAHEGDERALEFLDCEEMVVRAIIALGERNAAACREKAALTDDPDYRRDLLIMAETFDQVPARPAKTFRQAVQCLSMCFTFLPDCIGTIDRYLYPYYRADLDAGRLTIDEARSLIQELYIDIYAHTGTNAGNRADFSAESHFAIGGYLPDHTDGFNDLSRLLIDALMELPLNKPQISLRWTKKLPFETLKYVLDCERHDALKRIAIVNDEPRIKSFMDNLGLSFEDACGYTMVGCNEPSLVGGIWLGGCTTNIARSLSKLLERRGELIACRTFDEVYALYEQCLDADLERALEINNAFNEYRSRDTNTLSSIFLDGCIESAKSATQGGARLAVSGTNIMGMTCVIDSLTVIAQFVFEERAFTMEELLDALDANWEGRDFMRALILKRAKFFGNNDPLSDGIARRFTNSLHAFLAPRRNLFGNHLLLGCLAGYNPHYVYFGNLTGATPDGRFDGDPFMVGAGQTAGKDREGLTALLNSVAQMDESGILCGPFVCNLMLDEALIRNDDHFDKTAHMLETYFRMGGLHVQLNYVSREELLAAREHPEQYGHLRVRVSGFSGTFTLLEESIQDDIMRRTHQSD